jgi:hypothetical protein
LHHISCFFLLGFPSSSEIRIEGTCPSNCYNSCARRVEGLGATGIQADPGRRLKFWRPVLGRRINKARVAHRPECQPRAKGRMALHGDGMEAECDRHLCPPPLAPYYCSSDAMEVESKVGTAWRIFLSSYKTQHKPAKRSAR